MNEVRNDSINLVFQECSNRCEEVKWRQSLIQEEFKKLQCQWEKQAKAINFIRDGTHKNMTKLFNELNVECGLINQATLQDSAMGSHMAKVEEEVQKGKEWSRQIEEGQLVAMMERIQKLEDQMAEKDEEIAILRGKIRLLSCHDWL